MSAAQTAPNNMRLFLLIGQSNMAGRGIVEPQDQITHPRTFMLTKALRWELAIDPVHFDQPTLVGVGLGSEFARTLVNADPKIAVGLIPCAMGGTSLDQWQPGGALYANAVTRTREAMKNGKLAGILWHQGESEMKGSASAYGARFSTMIQQLRQDLGAEQVPVIVGELGQFLREPNVLEFRAAFSKLPESVPLCGFVSSTGLADKGDKLHFDSPSLRIFGARYAAAFAEITARK